MDSPGALLIIIVLYHGLLILIVIYAFAHLSGEYSGSVLL